MAKFRTEDFKTPLCRLSYARTLFKARVVKNSAPKYGCTLIFDKKDRPALEKYVRDCIVGEWKDNGLERAKKGIIKSPFLDGDGKEARNKETGEVHPGLGPDKFFIRCTANEDRPPAVRWKNANLQESEETVYSGCYGKAVLNVFAWHADEQGDGVSFGIQMFQKHQDGEHLGGTGSIDVEKHFETIEDAEAPESTRDGKGAEGLFS